MMTWELVPLKPKELTPAMRVPLSSGHFTFCWGTTAGILPRLMRGLQFLKCKLWGMVWCFMASSTLITPATPAAASKCPQLVLTEPM